MSAIYAHDAPGLPYAVAKATKVCQLCGDSPARVCAARPRYKPSPAQAWWVAVLCEDCIAEQRADRKWRVVLVVAV
jgi:hypothetical protein